MNMQGQITDPKAALTFMLGGKAFITFRSLSSGNRYTYRIEQTDKDPNRYFVNVLVGPDNWSNYKYMGMLNKCPKGSVSFTRTAGSKIAEDAPSCIGFNFCLAKIKNGIIDGFEVWHEGKCGRCGRKLTVPESVASGFGPDCIEMVGGVRPTLKIEDVGKMLDFGVRGNAAPQPGTVLILGGGVKAHHGVPASAIEHASSLDTEIRRRIKEYKANGPENYYHDGELSESQAFSVAYNMFRVEIEREQKKETA